jgi:formylglycine-generating enzyme
MPDVSLPNPMLLVDLGDLAADFAVGRAALIDFHLICPGYAGTPSVRCKLAATLNAAHWQLSPRPRLEEPGYWFFSQNLILDGVAANAALRKALSKEKDKRFNTCCEFVDALAAALAAAGQGAGSVVRPARAGGETIEIEIAAGVAMKFCWVPPGKALLGSPATEQGRGDNEHEHEFATKGFWLGKYAVTQEQWRALMGGNPSYFSDGGGGKLEVGGMDTRWFPAENVSWEQCWEFLRKLKVPTSLGKGRFALPHADEWEYACRGGKGNKQPFYFGSELNGMQANCDGGSPYETPTRGPKRGRTTEVGSYEEVAPHPWGLCDMCGNVWEWCANVYSGDARVVRGGSWNYDAWHCRSASRYWFEPGARDISLGFRVAFLLDLS